MGTIATSFHLAESLTPILLCINGYMPGQWLEGECLLVCRACRDMAGQPLIT